MKKIVRAKNKFTPETQDKLLAAIRGGNFRVVACQLAGITNKTLYEWLKNPKPEYQEFHKKLIEAEAGVEAYCVSQLINAGEKDPKWYAWYLERKFKRWNTAVHRWEINILQKQLKELRHVINELCQDDQGSAISEIEITTPQAIETSDKQSPY